MGLDDVLGNGKANAAACGVAFLRLCPSLKVPGKEGVDILRGDADSGVCNGEFEEFLVSFDGVGGVDAGDSERASFRIVFDGIVDEVGQGFLELGSVNEKSCVRGQGGGDGEMLCGDAVCKESEDAGEYLGKGSLLSGKGGLANFQFRDGDELFDEGGAAVGG